MDQDAHLKSFFAPATWRPSMDRFPLSGYALVDAVNALAPGVVVDVGCGFNHFKGKIRNLVGIDLVNDAADLVCDLHAAPFADASVDVALALGSINFGTAGDIVLALRTVQRWLRPGGRLYMRGNPGEAIGAGIVVFPWSAEQAAALGTDAGLQLAAPVREEHLVLSTGVAARRLFWVYVKPASSEGASV